MESTENNSNHNNSCGFLADTNESNDQYIPSSKSFSSSSKDSASPRKRRKTRRLLYTNSCRADHVDTVLNLSSRSQSLMPSLVSYSDTDGGESSDSASFNEKQALNKKETIQVPDGADVAPDVYNDRAILTTQTPKQKVYLSRDNTCRKRKRNPQCWKKNKASILRGKGEGYISYSGKDIPKKTPNLGMLCNSKCPFHCNEKFSLQQREHIFFNFYKLDTNAKNAYLFNCISIMAVQRERKDAKIHKTSSFKYVVKNELENVRVCKTALAALFSVGRGKIDHIQKSLKAGYSVPPSDSRGKHMNRPHRIAPQVSEYIESHIKSFPSEESHYSGNKNIHKQYLSPLLSIKKMYQLYLDEVNKDGKPENFKVAECTYRDIFSSKFNLSFGHPRSNTCSTCELGEVNEKNASSYRQEFDLQKIDRELSERRCCLSNSRFTTGHASP